MDVLSIEWKGFGEALAGDLWQFYNSNEHSDVTICTDDGHEIKSHRILLAICSKYFRELFKRFKTPNQIVCLSNIRFDIAKKIFGLIYGGFVQIPPSDVHAFIKAAKFLQLQGFEDINPGTDLEGLGTAQGSKHERYTIKIKRIDVSQHAAQADDTSETATEKSPEFSPFVASAIGTNKLKRKYHSSDESDGFSSGSDEPFSTGESSDVSVN